MQIENTFPLSFEQADEAVEYYGSCSVDELAEIHARLEYAIKARMESGEHSKYVHEV